MTCEAMVDLFKEFNANWAKTKVVISDKDFADRSVFKGKFPGVAVQICLCHSLVIFKREITPAKREITTNQCEKCLAIRHGIFEVS